MPLLIIHYGSFLYKTSESAKLVTKYILILIIIFFRSRTTTITQTKAQPPSKFHFDRNSLRTLEISSPIQVPPPALAKSSNSTVQNCYNKHLDGSTIQISSPIPPNTVQADKFLPVRPAPPRPNSVSKWTPANTVASPGVSRTSSLRHPPENTIGNRPLSCATFRPNCPPPRPPLPKANLPSQIQQDVNYADVSKLNQNERSTTPSSSFYDDCQTLDFSDTNLAFVHKPTQNSIKDNNNCDLMHLKKSNFSQGRSSFLHKPNRKNLSVRANNPGENVSKVLPHGLRTNENSVVASLAQKFEKQDNLISSNDINSLMPPFKSRPLPSPPDNP